MTAQTDQMRLFGLDLRAIGRTMAHDWAQCLRGPVGDWFFPDEPVRVLRQDGTDAVVVGCSAQPAAGGIKPRFVALEVPAEYVLERTLMLPDLPQADLAAAVALDVQGNSPFAEADLVWAWQRKPGPGAQPVRVVLAARAHLERLISEQAARLEGIAPELWFDATSPILLPGFGEMPRQRRQRQRATLHVVLLAVLLLLLLALALSPVLLARQKTMEAQAALNALQDKAKNVIAQRDQVAKANDKLNDLGSHLGKKLEVAGLINTITRLLPDDAVLDRLEIRADLVRLSGRASEAAKLMQILSAQKEFTSVRAPSAISRNATTGKENFVIEFNVAAPGIVLPPAEDATDKPRDAASAAPDAAKAGAAADNKAAAKSDAKPEVKPEVKTPTDAAAKSDASAKSAAPAEATKPPAPSAAAAAPAHGDKRAVKPVDVRPPKAGESPPESPPESPAKARRGANARERDHGSATAEEAKP